MIDLQPFCSTDPMRYMIAAPFSRGAWTYASDGHVLIRVDRRDDVPERPDAPHAERILDPTAGVDLIDYTMPELPPAKFSKCVRCSGSGRKHTDCDHCECPCIDCDGDGKFSILQAIEVHGTRVNVEILRRLAALPNLRVATNPIPRHPIRFEFDGGVGCFIPVVKGDEEGSVSQVESGR